MYCGGNNNDISKVLIKAAEKIMGLEFADYERDSLIEDLTVVREDYKCIREVELANSVFP